MIPVVGFNAVLMSEHFGAFFAFGVLHGALFIRYVKVSSLAGMLLRAGHILGSSCPIPAFSEKIEVASCQGGLPGGLNQSRPIHSSSGI